jgi:tetratricopeptide (TPR) repeat protein
MEEKTTTKPSGLSRTGLKIILTTLGVSIIFFIPFLPVGLVFVKGLILTLGAAIGLIFYFIDCISVGRILLPRGHTWKVFLGLVVASAITSFFVPNPLNSFLGGGFDIMTVSTLSIAFIYFFLINVWGNGLNFTKNIFKTVFITGFVAVVFSILQLVFNLVGQFPKMFVGLSNSNLVGSFYDLAFLLSIFVILLTISIESNFWNGPMKIVSTIGVVMSLGLLFIINYPMLWYVVGFSGLTLLIVGLMPNTKASVVNQDGTTTINSLISKTRNFSVIAFLLVFCAFIGIVGSKSIGNFFAAPPMSFSVNEPRPSLRSSLYIVKNTYYYNPLTGAGLNRYNNAWEMGKHKILGGRLVASPFWNVSFIAAYSTFFGFITTLGIVAGVFFVWFLYLIVRNLIKLFSKSSLQKSRPRDILLYGFTSVYAFALIMFNVSNAAIFVVIISIFAMLVARNQTMENVLNKEIVFINDARHSFFGILGLLGGTILTAFVGFVMLGVFYSGYLVNRAALQPATMDGVSKADSNLVRALKLHPLDAYARSAVDLHLIGVSTAIRDQGQSQEMLRNTITTEITAAATNAKLAINLDPKNYQNYVSLLKVQEALFQLGDVSAYSDTINNTKQILNLSPNNVGIIFRQAKAAVLAKNYADAYGFIDQILSINPAFVDAYILRSQIAMIENNPVNAISGLDEAIKIIPNSAALNYQKGLIYTTQNNYNNAVVEFEKALRIAPRSLDIYSSLALTYEKLGQKDAVLRVLTTARQYISDKTQIDSLIEKINNGGRLSSDADEPIIVDEESKDSEKIDTKKVTE